MGAPPTQTRGRRQRRLGAPPDTRPTFPCVGEHRPVEWGRRVCEGLSSTLRGSRCGGSASCVLCALWAVLAAVLVGGGGLLVVCIASIITLLEMKKAPLRYS